MKLSIIIVNYKSEKLLQNCLKSLSEFLYPKSQEKNVSFETIVVNNDNTPLSQTDFRTPFPLKIINHLKNVGFGAANNLGVKAAKGDFLLFLNPDTQITDESLLEMLEYHMSHQEIGAIGPKIILASQKRPQPWTCGKRSSILNIIFRNTINKPWNKQKITSVDWISGTALMVKKYDFQKIGGFDEDFFMYFEDQDLCLRIKALGKKNIIFPKATIIHFDGKSWQSNSCGQKNHFYKSQDYFFKKNHHNFQCFLLKVLRLLIKGH